MVSPPELNHCEPVVRYKFSMPRTSDKEDSTLSMISLDSSAEKFPRALIFISLQKDLLQQNKWFLYQSFHTWHIQRTKEA